MAQNLPANQSGETDLYCTPDHVAQVRREPPYSAHESRGRHTRDQVVKAIRWAMARIDSHCGQSWRRRVVTEEWQDLPQEVFDGVWTRVKLDNRQVADLASGSGDALQVRAGSSWEDYLTTRTQGIAGDFYIQNEDGWLYLKRRTSLVTEDAIKITYRTGFTTVPEDIQEACALLTAARLEETSIRSIGPDGASSYAVENRARDWKKDAYASLVSKVIISGVN